MRFLILLSIMFLSFSQLDFDSETKVTFGSILKLRNPATGLSVKASSMIFGRGQVYLVHGQEPKDNEYNYWQIRSGSGNKIYTETVKCGDKINLFGVITGYALRLEDTQFGITNQLLPLVHTVPKEKQDDKINWTLHCVNKQNGDSVSFTDNIRLKHYSTGKYMSLDPVYVFTVRNCGQYCPIMGQTELNGLNSLDDSTTIFEVGSGIALKSQEGQA